MVTAETVREQVIRVASSGPHTERTAFFSDAVFAIAMTLLAVEITVPVAHGKDLAPSLLELVPELVSYALSFAVVGVYWMTHHRYFALLRRYTPGLQRLNLLMLLFVALIPFATNLLGSHPDESVAVAAYAAAVACVGGVQVWLWEHAWHHGLFTDELRPTMLTYLRTKSLIVPVVFLLSIPVTVLAGTLV